MDKQTELAKAREKWILSMENAAKSRSGRPLRNRSGRHAFPEVVRQRRQVLQGMAKPLKRWLIKHRDNPYPTREEKISLALGSQMTLMQVSNWFANARRRLKNTVKTPNADWSKRIKLYNSCVVGNAELLSISSDDSIWDSDGIYKDETEIIPSDVTVAQDRKTNEDHSYSVLDGLVPNCSLRDACRPQALTDARLVASHQVNKTPESKPHIQTSAPAVRCKREREASEDEGNFSDDAPCVAQYDHRPKKYKRHIMQRYLHDSYRMSQKRDEEAECQNQNGKCQRTETCRDSVGGSCSESERSHSNSQSPSSSNSARNFRFSEVEVSRQLFRPNENPPFGSERLKNGRYWKEFDAAVVLANLGRTATAKPPTSGLHSPAMGLGTTCT